MGQNAKLVNACFVKTRRRPAVVLRSVGQVPAFVQRVVVHIVDLLLYLFLRVHQNRQRIPPADPDLQSGVASPRVCNAICVKKKPILGP